MALLWDGTNLYISDGKLVEWVDGGDDCNCCGSAVDCPNCPDGTPSVIKLNIHSILISLNCWPTGGGGAIQATGGGGGVIGGVFSLNDIDVPQSVGDPCVWETFVDGVEVAFFLANDCSIPDPGNLPDSTVYIRIERINATQYHVCILWWRGPVGIFECTVTCDCMQATTNNPNDYTYYDHTGEATFPAANCNSNSYFVLGISGAIDLTPQP